MSRTMYRLDGKVCIKLDVVGPLFSKGGFFSESVIGFSDLQISKKKMFQKTILSLKFKFQVHDSFFEYFFFDIWRFEK